MAGTARPTKRGLLFRKALRNCCRQVFCLLTVGQASTEAKAERQREVEKNPQLGGFFEVL